MDNQLTPLQKELRKVRKKIRHLKSKEGSWDMDKVASLEEQQESLEKRLLLEQKKKDEAVAKEVREKEMTEDDWLEHFREARVEEQEDHSIPNNPQTRRHRKKVIQNLQIHIMGEYMNQQMRLRREIIQQIKNELEKEKEQESADGTGSGKSLMVSGVQEEISTS
jgi:cyanate lyase